MTTWQPMTDPYEADNSLVVTPVGSSDALMTIGLTLNNGLQVSQPRDHWADLCAGGKRQILEVTYSDTIVACAELRVVGGKAEALFVRGRNNEEMGPGTASFDAVTSYVAAVNDRKPGLALALEPRGNGFTAPAPVAEVSAAPVPVLSVWERAVRFAADYLGMSPFQALAAVPKVAEPVIEGDQPVLPQAAEEWTPLTGRFERDGVTIEPVSSMAALEVLGEELENNLFMPEMAQNVANGCRQGLAQIAALYTKEAGVIGFAALRVEDGALAIKGARGFAEKPLAPEVMEVLTSYVEAINSNQLKTNVALGERGFQTADHTDEAEYYSSLSQDVLPQATRHGGGYGHNSGDTGVEGDYEDGEDEDLEDDADLEGSWPAFSSEFTSYGGLTLRPLNDVSSLESLAEDMGRPHMGRDADETIAECRNGSLQVFEVLDADGETMGAVDIIVREGRVKPLFDREMTSLAALTAVNEYCDAVNTRSPRVTLLGSIGEQGFNLPTDLKAAARNSQLGGYGGQDFGDEGGQSPGR